MTSLGRIQGGRAGGAAPEGQLACWEAGLEPSASATHHLPTLPPPSTCLQDGYQQRYFYIDSFEAGAEQLRAYCRSLQQQLPEDVRAAVEAAVGREP